MLTSALNVSEGRRNGGRERLRPPSAHAQPDTAEIPVVVAVNIRPLIYDELDGCRECLHVTEGEHRYAALTHPFNY
jgi:hypothetical protein